MRRNPSCPSSTLSSGLAKINWFLSVTLQPHVVKPVSWFFIDARWPATREQPYRFYFPRIRLRFLFHRWLPSPVLQTRVLSHGRNDPISIPANTLLVTYNRWNEIRCIAKEHEAQARSRRGCIIKFDTPITRKRACQLWKLIVVNQWYLRTMQIAAEIHEHW